MTSRPNQDYIFTFSVNSVIFASWLLLASCCLLLTADTSWLLLDSLNKNSPKYVYNWLSLIKTNCHKLEFFPDISTPEQLTHIFSINALKRVLLILVTVAPVPIQKMQFDCGSITALDDTKSNPTVQFIIMQQQWNYYLSLLWIMHWYDNIWNVLQLWSKNINTLLMSAQYSY